MWPRGRAEAAEAPLEPKLVRLTRVRVGPPQEASLLAWPLILIGPPLLVLGLVTGEPGYEIFAISAGAGATLLGGYLLWIHDWSSHLPPAASGAASEQAAGHAAPPLYGIGYGLRF